MIDYLYKFPDEATAQSALADYCGEDGWKTSGEGYALDPVGPLFDSDEGGKLVPLDGWHLNLRVLDSRPDPSPEFSVTPTNPRRVWL